MINQKLKINSSNNLTFKLKKEKGNYSRDKTRLLFRKIVYSLPQKKGAVVITGIRQKTEKVLCYLVSENQLRYDLFTTPKNLNDGTGELFDWIVEQLNAGEYSEIAFYPAVAV